MLLPSSIPRRRSPLPGLNETPGKLLPGVKLETFYDRTTLISRTTETVRENVIVGVILVTLILYVFLNDIRSSLIVAINIPLSLLFAFAMLYFRRQRRGGALAPLWLSLLPPLAMLGGASWFWAVIRDGHDPNGRSQPFLDAFTSIKADGFKRRERMRRGSIKRDAGARDIGKFF